MDKPCAAEEKEPTGLIVERMKKDDVSPPSSNGKHSVVLGVTKPFQGSDLAPAKLILGKCVEAMEGGRIPNFHRLVRGYEDVMAWL